MGKELKKFLPGIQKNVSLANFTTFRIGGPAKYFFIANNEKDLIKALNFAREQNLPYCVLGGGSNLLVADNGFNGLVIKIRNSQFAIRNSQIITEAGVLLGVLVVQAMKNGFSGLEWATGIPGTIGGAVYGNAGAYGHSISEAVKSVKTIDNRLQIKDYKLKDCKFGYRYSVFKKNKEIILLVVLKLKRGAAENIKEKMKECNQKRGVPSFPNAGCVFKNIFAKDLSKNILSLIPQEKIIYGKIPAGFLIDQCGLRGKKSGEAQIWEKHANYIVNLGPLRQSGSEASSAKTKDVFNLISLCKQKVKEKFNIDLEEEIQFLGF